MSSIVEWLDHLKAKNVMRVEKIPTPEIGEGGDWGHDREKGLCRGDGKQFSIPLFEVFAGESREVPFWRQPLIIEAKSEDLSKVSLLVAKINGQTKILIWAKYEPGAFNSPGHLHLNPTMSSSAATFARDVIGEGADVKCTCMTRRRKDLCLIVGEDAGRAGGKNVETSVVIRDMTPEKMAEIKLDPDHRWCTFGEIQLAVEAGYHLSSKLTSALGILLLNGVWGH